MTGLFWAALGAAMLAGFFALANYSLRDFRRALLEEAFGPAGSKRLARLEEHLAALRLTTAFCRSLANLVLVVSMLFLFEAHASAWRLLLAIATAWATIGILGEAIPHAWAYASGEKVLAAVLEPLMFFRYALWPVIAVMQAFDMPIRRLSGVDQDDLPGPREAKQEILQAASDGRAEGAVDAEEVKMIKSVMEFGDREAREVMTPRTDIVAAPAATTWADACRLIHRTGHTRIPIYEGHLDNIVGVLYAKDLLQFDASTAPADLRTLMRKPFFVPESKRLGDLLREFKSRKVHVAIVLDEYGGTAGLVSFEDVLEEIVGEISDEYDRPTPALMKRIDDATAEIDGRMYIDDLNEAMGLGIPEDTAYDTVAGLVFAELGYVPRADETLDAHGARFTVIAADERRITRVKVHKLPEPDAQE